MLYIHKINQTPMQKGLNFDKAYRKFKLSLMNTTSEPKLQY